MTWCRRGSGKAKQRTASEIGDRREKGEEGLAAGSMPIGGSGVTSVVSKLSAVSISPDVRGRA